VSVAFFVSFVRTLLDDYLIRNFKENFSQNPQRTPSSQPDDSLSAIGGEAPPIFCDKEKGGN
jgi:hypothetical protein